MSIISNIMNSMSEDDKAKLGRVGSKVNTDGAHKLKITEAYEITSEGGKYPRFVLKMEDAEGKSLDWTGFLKQTVGKDDKGVVKAGEYSVNGVKTYLDTEGAEYDNIKVIGQINNLWKVVGLDPNQFGAGIKPSTVTFPDKGTQAIESWTALIGKEFTGVTSYVISLDKDGKRAWRNQDINMNALFTAEGLSLAEKEAGKTEGTALDVAIAAAKANASIKYNDRANKICIQELKLVQSNGTVPATESVAATAPAGTDPF
jgi:hypothetical protein